MTDPFAVLIRQHSDIAEQQQRPHLWPLIVLAIILMVIAVATLGDRPVDSVPDTSTTPGHDARVYTVSYRFGVFSPTNLRIRVGDTVRWRNDGVLPVRIVAQMQVNQRTPLFDSIGEVQSGSVFSYTFATVGTFGYSNADQTAESGVIIVRE